MRLGKWSPHPVQSMDKVYPDYTICETIRRIYNRTDDEQIRYLCRIATTMAKHMMDKLVEYNKNSHAEIWTDKTSDVERQLNELT